MLWGSGLRVEPRFELFDHGWREVAHPDFERSRMLRLVAEVYRGRHPADA